MLLLRRFLHASRGTSIQNTVTQNWCCCCLMQVVMAYTVGVAAMLVAFWATPATLAWAQWATVFMIGFFLYGPQMLIGLCGAELVGPESVGASEVRRLLACHCKSRQWFMHKAMQCPTWKLCLRMQGFLGWVAYLGAANAGVPLSIIVKNYGWNA